MNQIVWSKQAENSYLAVIDYLMTEWSLDVAANFDYKVTKLLKRLEQFKFACPPSVRRPGRRKCVITPQTSLIYRVIKDDKVELVTFIDNRRKPQY
jgi:plasmid stabilization system protein ParE